MYRCPVPIHDKWLTSPTAKDFQNLFRWIVNEWIDPAYSWPAKQFVDDATAVLRDLRYPVMESIGKTALSAPGDTRTWPAMLAMLAWMVELAKVSLCLAACMRQLHQDEEASRGDLDDWGRAL